MKIDLSEGFNKSQQQNKISFLMVCFRSLIKWIFLYTAADMFGFSAPSQFKLKYSNSSFLKCFSNGTRAR